MSTDNCPAGYTEQEWHDAKLRGIASNYFHDAQHWPAAMLCLQHLLMEQAKSAQPGLMQPGTKARKVGGKFEANGTIVAAWIDPDDGKPRYAFRFDFPAGMTHFYTAEQVRERRADDPVGMSPLGEDRMRVIAAAISGCSDPLMVKLMAMGELVEQAHDIR